MTLFQANDDQRERFSVIDVEGLKNARDAVKSYLDELNDGSKTVDKFVDSISGLEDNEINLITTFMDGRDATADLSKEFITASENVIKFRTVTASLLSTLKAAAVAFAVSFVVSKVVEGIQNYINRVEIAQQKTKDIAAEFEDSNATLESTKNELDEINEKISELNAQDALSFTEKSELNNLKEQREELEKTLKIQEQLNKAKANELAAAAYEEYFTTYGFNGGVTQEAIDSAYLNFSMSDENPSFLFDDNKDSGDLNTLIALMKELESAKEAAFNRNDLDAVADYDTKIKELNTKIWEQIQNLQNLKTYFDTIGYDNLTYYQKNVYDNLQSSIDFAMKLVDPESWNQMQFDSVFNKQTESMQQELMGLAKMGTVTAEQLNNSRFDPFMDELESLGFTAEQVAEQLNALYGKKQSDGDIAPEVTAAQKTVESLVEELSKLQEVQAAQNLGNGITAASYKELVAIDKEYADCIVYQNGQMQLNADKTRELTQEKANEKKATMELAKAQDQMKYFENAQEIENLQRKLKNASLYSEDFADSIYKKIEALESDNSVLQDNITQYDILIGQIDSATSAYTRWLNAQNAGRAGDMMSDAIAAFTYMKEVLIDTTSDNYGYWGKTNEKYMAALDFIVPDSVDSEDENAVRRYMNQLGRIINKDGKFNIDNVLQLMKNGGVLSAEAWKDGFVEFTEGTTIQDVMNALNVSEEIARAVLGELSDRGLEVNVEPAIKSFADLAQAATDAKDNIDKLWSDNGEKVTNGNVLVQEEYKNALMESRDAVKALSDAEKQYGNISNVNRDIIYWNKENLSKYKDVLADWNYQVNEGDWSTVLGSSETLKMNNGNFEIAYSALLQTENGLVPLTTREFGKYLNAIVEKASDQNGNLDVEKLMKLDATGLEMQVDGTTRTVKGLLAAVEGQIVNGAKLTQADVMAIAGRSADEIKSITGETSAYIGRSMHDIQAETLYSKAVFEKLSDAADIGEIKIDVSDVKSTEGKINTLNESIDKLKALHRMKLSAEDAEDVENTLRYCIAQKQMLEAPAVMSVNSADVEEGKRKILELVQQYETAKDELETASTLGLDTSEARAKVNSLFEEIRKESETAGIDIDTTNMEKLDEWIAGLSMEDVTVEFGVDSSVVADYIADANGENDGTGTIVYDVDRGKVDRFLKENLDRGATLTYKVTTSGTVYVGRSSAGSVSSYAAKSGEASASGTTKGEILSGGEPASGKMLVGEEGFEVYVNKNTGKWRTVGDNGPEFIQAEKGSIIFDHETSKKLLQRGFVNGPEVGEARAGGTGDGVSAGRIAISELGGTKANIKAVKDLSKSLTNLTSNAKNAQAAVKSLEKQVESLEEELDAVQKQGNLLKVIGEAATKEIEKRIDALEKQKEAIEANIDALEKIGNTYNIYGDAATEALDARIAELEAQKQALQDANDEEERAIQLAKLKDALAKAQNQKTVRVYSETEGYVWKQDENAIAEARNALDEQMRQWNLDDATKAIDDQIEQINDLKDQYQEAIGLIGTSWEDYQTQLAAQAEFANMSLEEMADYLTGFKDNVVENIKQIADEESKIEPLDGQIEALQELQEKYNETMSLIGMDWEEYQAMLSAQAMFENMTFDEMGSYHTDYTNRVLENMQAEYEKTKELEKAKKDLKAAQEAASGSGNGSAGGASVADVTPVDDSAERLKNLKESIGSLAESYANLNQQEQEVFAAIEAGTMGIVQGKVALEKVDREQAEAERELQSVMLDYADCVAMASDLSVEKKTQEMSAMADLLAQSGVSYGSINEMLDTYLVTLSSTYDLSSEEYQKAQEDLVALSEKYRENTAATDENTQKVNEHSAAVTNSANAVSDSNTLVEESSNTTKDTVVQNEQDMTDATERHAEAHGRRAGRVLEDDAIVTESSAVTSENLILNDQMVMDSSDQVLLKSNEVAQGVVLDNTMMDESAATMATNVGTSTGNVNTSLASMTTAADDTNRQVTGFFGSIGSAAVSMAQGIINWVGQAVDKIRELAGAKSTVENQEYSGTRYFASGTPRVDGSYNAVVDDKGPEIVVRPSTGRFTTLEIGDGVVPNHLTNTLFSAAINPAAYMQNALREQANKMPMASAGTQVVQIDVGGIHMEGVQDVDGFARALDANIGTVMTQMVNKRR